MLAVWVNPSNIIFKNFLITYPTFITECSLINTLKNYQNLYKRLFFKNNFNLKGDEHFNLCHLLKTGEWIGQEIGGWTI